MATKLSPDQREKRPREELLREYLNLGEGGPLCTPQASEHIMGGSLAQNI
jgi:hypothetical protein